MIDLGKEYYIWLKKEKKDRQKFVYPLPQHLTKNLFKICIGFGMRMDKFYASNLFDLKNISLENTSQKIYKV